MLRVGWRYISSVKGSRRFTITVVKGYCLLNCIDEYLISIRSTEGTSMLPTLSSAHDQAVNIRLPFYRFLSSTFPDFVRNWRLANFFNMAGIPNVKGDSSMGTGIRVGDLVVARSPLDPTMGVCKRVMGLPGDTILLDPRVDPSPLHKKEWSNIMKRPSNDTLNSLQEPVYITVPKGYVWLVGDNLGNSLDSRQYGPVPLGLVKGRVVAKMFTSFTWLPNTFQTLPQ